MQKTMQKLKINSLFIVSLVLVFAFSFFIASVSAYAAGKDDNIEKGNQAQSRDVEEHRSAVSNFVQSLLSVADREGGIGEQVRVIAREQNQSASTTVHAMGKIQSRSKIKTFFFGSDYKNLGALRSEIVQTKNRLNQLDKLVENAQTAVDKAELQNQVQTLKQEQQKIDTFLKANENKFSLFGWFTKLFSK
ncbi:hypothetical protein COY31_01090 [Candidatus Wolfebacteria bacterium CG_4_10_14_0_2_um_filter_39_18]|uniref:DUF5667 domain-containing protein n=1 Tax=Candidatus Wolfebacteria bacterium CG_4_10_14_0_2_um_filter_39_18 TaxID=1975061 RepID=A0A2M7TGA0_9BACT|nr:MAG: hypothetical protein COY31_01090 [Candidatus Wolfebacteria bacterium CG_4_10_14_0_2_um_filter_39_18]